MSGFQAFHDNRITFAELVAELTRDDLSAGSRQRRWPR